MEGPGRLPYLLSNLSLRGAGADPFPASGASAKAGGSGARPGAGGLGSPGCGEDGQRPAEAVCPEGRFAVVADPSGAPHSPGSGRDPN